MTELTATIVDRIINNGNLRITEKEVKWEQENNSHHKFTLHVNSEPSLLENKIIFLGVFNKRNDDFSLSLIIGRKRIRGVDPFDMVHNNKIDGKSVKKIRGIHKHSFNELYDDMTYAYKPEDLSDPKNPETTFYEFLKESNIQHNLLYIKQPGVQLELESW